MVTDRFIQLCPSRTGSNTEAKFLHRLGSLKKVHMINRIPHTGYETNVRMYREAGYTGDIPPVVTSVRNPWAWYVSKWWFILGEPMDGEPTFRKHMECVRDRARKGWNFGTFSNAWTLMGCQHADYVRRYEDFENEMIRVWTQVIPDLVDETEWRARMKELIGNRGGLGDTNTAHKPYQTYYDDEMREWVAMWDKTIIQRFGYTFEALEGS